MASSFRNLLLGGLPPDQLALLTPYLEPVELTVFQKIELPRQPIRHVYFPESGLLSVIAKSRSGDQEIEAGLIGREALSGAMVVMGNDRSPHQTEVQIGGAAHRIESDRLREAMKDDELRTILLRYVQVFSIQTAHTALANGRLKLEGRLARWLLMSHDRLETDEIELTHDFLALMIGVRRAGVTVAIHALEDAGLIRAGRGAITVIDREGLKKASDGGYGVPEAEYERLTGVAFGS
ncbi:Crp/Fnr family transcriptional regulator [Histidinibacterium aquaticum]|uniref:Crp/Fnr family transcriptional regulator n=1 Tax=Histidinibacterium aquaticum TaxID=2613962 RepID=A0A5J5GDU1_9RHOB|nr:Crp/Fnr family transcriptional regulator [Histidinibacterium aquaticum]KAA9005962.1 Crp/Fnr family transcriptional regulator [Histidinibacterium aquaticum]